MEHFLLSCSKYEEIRSELLSQLQGELEAIGERGFQVRRARVGEVRTQELVSGNYRNFSGVTIPLYLTKGEVLSDHFAVSYLENILKDQVFTTSGR